ncbi:MAG: heavy-metal-associated domain-containing protein [Bacteroidota bacterium]
MRTIIIFIILFCAAFVAPAQDSGIKTATFVVKGNCEECKKRIENAADIKGVKLAQWDEEKQAISVTYNSAKVSLDQIEKAVAASGHDTKNAKSNPAAYNKLPECCKYRDKKCEAPKK